MNAKQEILDAIAEIENCLDWGLPASGHVVTSRIRAILETHTLEPIDERPFDPALCGFERISGHPIWHRNDYSIIVSKIENQTAKQITVKELMGGLVGKRKDCWNEGEEAQGFKEFPCKDNDQGRCACDLEELAEISLAFAREVAGYPDAFWAGDYLDCGSAQRLPDYANDWNATIAALEQRGMSWGTEYIGGQKYFWVESGSLFESEEGPGPSALCLAAIKCVRRVRDEH